MKISKKIKIFFALISLFYCISLIQTTYAKYVTSADANTNLTIARWNILINNQDIKNNSNFTNTITPTFNGNSNIAANIIAPTSTGYFDIIIDGSGTDVAFKNTITITHSEQNTISDLIITKYTIDNDDTEYQLLNNQLEQIINLEDNNKNHIYRFYVEWKDDDNATMNNASDTSATIDGIAAFDINVNIIQIAQTIN